MSQSVPPQKQAPSDGPNPLELYFEKNRKWIIGLAAVLVLSLVGHYGLEAANASKRNSAWTEFTSKTGLNEKLTKMDLTKWPAQYQSFMVHMHWDTLVTKLQEDLEDADEAAVTRLLASTKGDEREPWVIWVAANKAYAERRWDDARKHCGDLLTRFPNHLLCATSAFPPQVLEQKEKKKDKSKDKDKKVDDEPEFEEPESGSMVGRLQARLDGEKAFESSHPSFFKAPEPDTSETVVIKFGSDVGEVEIAFYPGAAKAHVEAFKKAFTEGYYDKMRVHKIRRQGKDGNESTSPRAIFLGNPNSKEDDRTKWSQVPDAKKEEILEFEENDLSFFPGMVGAESEKDGKSSGRRFFIAVNDCAAEYDSKHVIFGKVIRGMEVLEDIAAGDFLDQSEQDQGQGRPSREILVESTTLKKK